MPIFPSTSTLLAVTGPVGLRAPHAVLFREVLLPLQLCAGWPCWPTFISSSCSEQAFLGLPALPHLQASLHCTSLCVRHWARLEIARGGPGPLVAHSVVRPHVPALLGKGCSGCLLQEAQPPPALMRPLVLQTFPATELTPCALLFFPPPSFSPSLQYWVP